MNKFQHSIHRHTKAATEVTGAILADIEAAGIGDSGLRDAYDDVNAAHGLLNVALDRIARVRNDGGEA